MITKTAQEKLMSIELPERIFNMLPIEINKAASLEGGRKKPTCALTIGVKVEKNGRVLDYKV